MKQTPPRETKNREPSVVEVEEGLERSINALFHANTMGPKTALFTYLDKEGESANGVYLTIANGKLQPSTKESIQFTTRIDAMAMTLETIKELYPDPEGLILVWRLLPTLEVDQHNDTELLRLRLVAVTGEPS